MMQKKWTTTIQNFLAVREEDPERELAGKILRFLCASLFVMFSVFSIHYFIQGVFLISGLQAMVAVISALAFGLYKKTKSTSIAGNFILSFGVISAFLRAYLMGGISSPAFFVWPIIPVCTMALMPVRWSLFWSSLYIGIALFFHFAEVMGHSFPSKVTPESIAAVRIVAIILVQVILLAVVYFFRGLNKQYRDLLASKRDEKTNLVRVITHDIAGPISILNYHTKKLEQKVGAAPEFERIHRAIKKMSLLTEEVRELEAIESGKKELQLSAVDVAKVIRELVSFMDVRIHEKHLTIDLSEIKTESGIFVQADESALSHQVLGNLLTNAIKFTPDGGTVKISLKTDGDQVHVSFIDSGIGMPKELVDKIFDSRKQTTRAGTAGESGTGFGMPILKSTVERFGGTVAVKSKPIEEFPQDHGTEVTLNFKVADQVNAA